MRILLDECLPLDFRHSFPDHDARTVEWAGFQGRANSDLLRAAEAAGYDVFITVDQGVAKQAGLGGRRLWIIVIRSRTNRLEDLLPFVDPILEALESIEPDRRLNLLLDGGECATAVQYCARGRHRGTARIGIRRCATKWRGGRHRATLRARRGHARP